MDAARALLDRLRQRLNEGLEINIVSRAQVESLGHFQIPESAEVLEARAHGFLSITCYVRLALPPEALDAFLAGTLVALPLAARRPRRMPVRVGGMRSFLAGEATQGWVHQSVLIDTSSPARYTAHVYTVSE